MPPSTDDEKKDEAKRLLAAVFSKLSHPAASGLPLYKPQAMDIVISTYPKSGTTLLQNMAYQIAVATGGAPPFDPTGTSFADIQDVVPWLDFGPEFGVMECPTSPRMFKTHTPINAFDITKAKFIYCIRNPFDIPASWLDFLLEWSLGMEVTDPEVREQIFHDYVRVRILGNCGVGADETLSESERGSPGSWFGHVKAAVSASQKNVMLLIYEDVCLDLQGTAQKIARFMGRKLSNAALQTVVERCGRDVMASDIRFRCNHAANLFGFGPNGGMKARAANSPGFKGTNFEESSVKACAEMMEATFGIANYAELCKMVRKIQESVDSCDAFS